MSNFFKNSYITYLLIECYLRLTSGIYCVIKNENDKTRVLKVGNHRKNH